MLFQTVKLPRNIKWEENKGERDAQRKTHKSRKFRSEVQEEREVKTDLNKIENTE